MGDILAGRRRRKKEKRFKVTAFGLFICVFGILGAFLAFGRYGIVSRTVPAYARYYEIAHAELEERHSLAPAANVDISALRDLGTLRNKYYAVDKKTGMTNEMFNIDSLMSRSVHIDKSLFKPKVLIFHTHAHEMYADSGEGGGVVGAGELLKKTLEKEYGIKCLHVTESFDRVNGELQILGAYERMEPRIREILKENPSIEMVIDLHRDGVGENVRLVSDVNGENCAKIMFFNGLCEKIGSDGVLRQPDGLENPYVEDNLALSLKAQMSAERLYPGLTRKIYLNAYRYSLHMKPLSMLIELGAQTNTEAEVRNSVVKLAEIIYETSFKDE